MELFNTKYKLFTIWCQHLVSSTFIFELACHGCFDRACLAYAKSVISSNYVWPICLLSFCIMYYQSWYYFLTVLGTCFIILPLYFFSCYMLYFYTWHLIVYIPSQFILSLAPLSDEFMKKEDYIYDYQNWALKIQSDIFSVIE